MKSVFINFIQFFRRYSNLSLLFLGGPFLTISPFVLTVGQDKNKIFPKLPEIGRFEKNCKLKVNGKEVTYSLVFDSMPVKTDSLSTCKE